MSVKLSGGPTQPFNVGTAVTTAVTGVLEPLLVPVKGAILPVPFAARPMAVLLFTHETDAPAGVEPNAGGAICC